MNTIVIFSAIVAACAALDVMPVPIKYVTTENFAVDSGEKMLFSADIGCDMKTDFVIDVCAELPLNWQWNPFSGVVFLNIYNNSLDTNNLDKAMASTGRPDKTYKDLDRCITIKNWPSGDLYVRVDPNNYAPVVFTISVQIRFEETMNEIIRIDQRAMRHKPKMPKIVMPRIGRAKAGQIVALTPVVLFSEPVSLEFDKTITLELNLCMAPHAGSNKIMTTSVTAKTGTYTHFICDALPCHPDSPDVIGSENSPLPAAFAHAGVSNIQQVYVTVYCAGGVYNNTTRTVVGDFYFGAVVN